MMKCKLNPFAILLLTFLVWTQLPAQNIGGYVKTFGYLNPNDSLRFDRAGSRLQLKVEDRIGSRAAYFAAMDFNYDGAKASELPNASRSSGLTIYPVEAYVDLFTKYADFRLGQQFIFWGRTDWVNPTDNINPWDYQNISSEIEDYRIPVMAARGNFYLGPVKLQAVGVPFFTPDKIPLPTDSIITPAKNLSNSEYGLRLSSYLGTLDYSFSYFHGYDGTPAIFANFLSVPPVPPKIYAKYFPIDVYGFDFVTTMGAWAIKSESAFFQTEDKNGDNPGIENPYIESVVGLDYVPTTKFSVTAQLVHNYKFHYHRNIEQMNPMGTEPRQTFSTAVRAQWDLAKFVSWQLISVYNFHDGDSFTLSFINWDVADGVNITFGGLLFQGPPNSPFGRSAKQDNIFAEFKISF